MATINYNGMELEEVTTPQIFDPPRECIAWDNPVDFNGNILYEKKVVAILPKSSGFGYRVICNGNQSFRHCALLPDPPKPRRATIREFAKWCAQGNGQIQDTSRLNCVFTGLDYGPDCDDDVAPEIYKVRKWSDTEWHEPTVDYLFKEANDEGK